MKERPPSGGCSSAFAGARTPRGGHSFKDPVHRPAEASGPLVDLPSGGPKICGLSRIDTLWYDMYNNIIQV